MTPRDPAGDRAAALPGPRVRRGAADRPRLGGPRGHGHHRRPLLGDGHGQRRRHAAPRLRRHCPHGRAVDECGRAGRPGRAGRRAGDGGTVAPASWARSWRWPGSWSSPGRRWPGRPSSRRSATTSPPPPPAPTPAAVDQALGDLSGGGWRWLALAGGVGVAGAGVATVVRGPRWPAMGRRYEAPAVARRPQDETDLWRAQDRGDDPTAPTGGDPADPPTRPGERGGFAGWAAKAAPPQRCSAAEAPPSLWPWRGTRWLQRLTQ